MTPATEPARSTVTLRLLKEHAKRAGPFDSLSAIDFLRRLYGAAKAELPRYSYRAFAEDLGFGATNYLHLICKGSRPLSVGAAQRIASALAFKEREKRYFILLARYEASRSPVEREVFFEEIVETKARMLGQSESKDGFAYFSEWFHAAIRETVLLPDFQADPDWIARRLLPRVTPDEARRSWELLLRLGLVHQDAVSGRWLQAESRITQAEGARGVAIVRYHQKMAELGKDCVTRALFETLKAEADAWQQRILAAAESIDDAEEIYQVNIQLFPLTQKRIEGATK